MDVYSVLRCVSNKAQNVCKFYKFYICAVVGVIIEYLTSPTFPLDVQFPGKFRFMPKG